MLVCYEKYGAIDMSYKINAFQLHYHFSAIRWKQLMPTNEFLITFLHLQRLQRLALGDDYGFVVVVGHYRLN